MPVLPIFSLCSPGPRNQTLSPDPGKSNCKNHINSDRNLLLVPQFKSDEIVKSFRQLETNKQIWNLVKFAFTRTGVDQDGPSYHIILWKIVHYLLIPSCKLSCILVLAWRAILFARRAPDKVEGQCEGWGGGASKIRRRQREPLERWTACWELEPLRICHYWEIGLEQRRRRTLRTVTSLKISATCLWDQLDHGGRFDQHRNDGDQACWLGSYRLWSFPVSSSVIFSSCILIVIPCALIVRYFLYNPETGEILSRTPISWLKIIVFYCIYYSCLGLIR